MSNFAQRVSAKLRTEGAKGAFKAAGRAVHSKLFSTDWDMELVPSILESSLRKKQRVSIIQIGANVGNTPSDPLYPFLTRNFRADPKPGVTCCAVLVEPVKHLYRDLIKNYAGVKGAFCENVAIAATREPKKFYRLREGVDWARYGLDPWAEQLGSFLPENLEGLWRKAADPEAARRLVMENTVVDEVTCMTFDDLLVKYQLRDLDLLQLDTEGYDYEILKTIDFNRVRPHYINYERIHLKRHEGSCRELLLRAGYHLHDHGQDTLCTLQAPDKQSANLRAHLYNRWLDLIH